MDSDQFATSAAGTDRGMTSLEVAETWYRSRDLDDGVVLITARSIALSLPVRDCQPIDLMVAREGI